MPARSTEAREPSDVEWRVRPPLCERSDWRIQVEMKPSTVDLTEYTMRTRHTVARRLRHFRVAVCDREVRGKEGKVRWSQAQGGRVNSWVGENNKRRPRVVMGRVGPRADRAGLCVVMVHTRCKGGRWDSRSLYDWTNFCTVNSMGGMAMRL
jgi:hypothetical protein